jgi:hypothetical protein
MSGEHCLSWGGAVVFPGCCTEAQEDPRDVVIPVRRSAEGAEGVLQAAVEAFHHPVGLRVVGRSLVVLDVEHTAEGGPQGGGELGPSV